MSEPLANVHDVIVLPFEVNQNTSKHSFSWERPLPADLKNEEAIADKRKQLRELVNLETKAINGAAAHLALCQTRYSSPTRDHLGLSTSAMISAWFEAVREGSVLLKTGPLGGNQSQAVPLFIAKQAAPLCVVAHCTSGREIGIGISDRCTDTAGVPVNDLYPVRLGDLLDLQCWEHRSSFKHPVPPPALCTTTMSVQVEFGMHGATHLINAADPPSTK
jgi:hypothetical protein